MLHRLRLWARALMIDALALWIAARDARTPPAARALALVVAAYAFSPIDLIPDIVPVLGLLDDLVLVPLGVMAVRALVPPPLMDEFRAAARAWSERPTSRAAAIAVVGLWLAALALIAVTFAGR